MVTTHYKNNIKMRKILLTLFVGFLGLSNTTAQEINVLPANSETNNLPDGWHQFQLQGASLDVEILGGQYVQGNVKWLDGSTYSGGLNGVYVSGRGTYSWSSGTRYEGALRKGQRHGKGSLILANGNKWSGKWKNNKKNGKGKVFDKGGVILKTGVWEEDKLVSN